jgi:hypothetical protein
MTEADDSDHGPIHVQAEMAGDNRRAMLRFKDGDRELLMVAADTASVEALISALGSTRSEMLDPVPADMPEGVHPLAAYNPRWYVLPDSENRFATFWIRHPGFGWTGYGFPRHEAGNIAKWLRKVTTITSTRDTQSPAATSFGGDQFLLTTEGLGFYYYGKGETRIGPNPFEQVEFDSDRAAGIVAGSIAERRLEQAVRSRIRSDKPMITRDLFRPSGALGPFSIKIDVAYLMNILTDDAYKDLVNLKNIRNDFAHDLELDSFDAQSVRDRCSNFILVDRHIGPIHGAIDANPYMGLAD